MVIYFMASWNILLAFRKFYDHLVHFVLIWYIFPVLVLYTKKDLATLVVRQQVSALYSYGPACTYICLFYLQQLKKMPELKQFWEQFILIVQNKTTFRETTETLPRPAI
jgi:uncharacterized membrane protein YdfJ with MMPL/SSD domain